MWTILRAADRLLVVGAIVLFLLFVDRALAHDALPMQELCELADEHGNGVPPNLVVAQIQEESGGQPDIESSAGAVGLMQIIAKFHPGTDLTDPATNIDVGTSILIQDWLYLNQKRSGITSADKIDWKNEDWLQRALEGYVMGPGNVVWYDQHPDKTVHHDVFYYQLNIRSLNKQELCKPWLQ